MKKSRILHIQTLIDNHACQNQVDLFRATFGESVVVTRARAIKYAQKFDFHWARRLLSAPAWAECDKVRAAAWAECDKVRAAAWAEYKKVCAAAWAEYDKVIAVAWAEYKKVIAVAWADAYIGDQS